MPELQVIDLEFQGLTGAIAAYLLRGPAGLALIETGPGSSLPAMQRKLAQLGIQPAEVTDVLLTHIHLDHAGAAGWWARQGARIYVHPVGAPHLVDPSKLLASATRIYGAQMGPLWGDMWPVPAEQLRTLADGERVKVAGLELQALDTPGHARHHLAYRWEDVLFTGDVAGVRLTPHRYMRVPSPPPEFEREVWHASVARLRRLNFRRLYLTHFDAVDDPAAHWDQVDEFVDAYALGVQRGLQAGRTRDEILIELRAWDTQLQHAAGLDEAALTRYRSVGPMDMSVDGVLRYWNKRAA